MAAHTPNVSPYPPYINIGVTSDGAVRVTLRARAKSHHGVYVCGYHPRDSRTAGRCTPGNQHCNNYCNMSPERGPMQDSPRDCVHIDCGPVVAADFDREAMIQVLEETLAELREVS